MRSIVHTFIIKSRKYAATVTLPGTSHPFKILEDRTGKLPRGLYCTEGDAGVTGKYKPVNLQ